MAQTEGFQDCISKLHEMGTARELRTTLLKAARDPMKPVLARAQGAIAKISPTPGRRQGKPDRDTHKTYKGRSVQYGFSRESLKLHVFIDKSRTRAVAMLGVRKEAYYALQFHELGTAHIPAKPWLVPSFEGAKGEALDTVKTVFRKRLISIAKKRKKGK